MSELGPCSDQLLPCPFCGSAPEIGYLDYNDEWFVHCPDYDCEVAPFLWRRKKPEAIAAWNHRAGARVPYERPRLVHVDELEAENAKLRLQLNEMGRILIAYAQSLDEINDKADAGAGHTVPIVRAYLHGIGIEVDE